MACSEVSASGHLHYWTIGPQRRQIWFTVQAPQGGNWGGGQAGQAPAGLSPFAEAPAGRTFVSVAARVSRNGVLNFWAGLDNGDQLGCWQRPNESEWRTWSGSGRLSLFARRP